MSRRCVNTSGRNYARHRVERPSRVASSVTMLLPARHCKIPGILRAILVCLARRATLSFTGEDTKQGSPRRAAWAALSPDVAHVLNTNPRNEQSTLLIHRSCLVD